MNDRKARLLGLAAIGPLLAAGLASCGGGASPGSRTVSPLASAYSTPPVATTRADSGPATAVPSAALSAPAVAASGCPSTLHFDGGGETHSETAADGRTIIVHHLRFDASAWLTSSSLALRRGSAEGSRIVWIAEAKHFSGEQVTPPPPGPYAPGKLMLEDCGEGANPAVIAAIPANHGEFDLPVLSGDDIAWVWWASSGPDLGSWNVSAYDTRSKTTTTVIQSGKSNFLPDPPSDHEPLVPSPQVDGGRYITSVKTADPGVSNILVGSLATGTHHFITDFGPASKPFAVPPSQSAISGETAAYVLATASSPWNIWVYNFATDTKRQVTNTGAMSDGQVVDLDPRLSGDHLAYIQTLQQGPGDGSVWLQDLSSGKRVALSPSLSGDGRPEQLAISSDWVIWETLGTLHFVPTDHPDMAYEVSLGDVTSGGVGTVVGLQAQADNITWTSESPDATSPGEWISHLYWFRLPPAP